MALYVFIAAGLGLLAGYLSAQELIESTGATTVAFADLQDIMERMQATPFANLGTDFPDDGAADCNASRSYAALVGGYSLTGEAITVFYPAGVTADPTEIIVTACWSTRNRQRTVSLSLMKTGH